MESVTGRPLGESPADLISRTVQDRATHRTRDQVAKTLSDWSVADLVAGEYHGRFLIELIQNARDALLERSPATRDGTLLVRLTKDPALIVANVGTDLTADTVLTAIGRFGLGTKTEGKSIGHKGIGFKSVLEISLTPEIYSCRGGDSFELAVRFDPIWAAGEVRDNSPAWDETVQDLLRAGDSSGAFHIPTLLFPRWVDDPRARIGSAAEVGGVRFDTIIRLPYDPRFDSELGLNRDSFIESAQAAMRGLSDQMVLLLEAFGTIVIEDEVLMSRETIRRVEVGFGTVGQDNWTDVSITRNWDESSRWRLFKRVLPELQDLEGDIAVGMRLRANEVGSLTIGSPIVRAGDAGGSFHLFFPTEIATRLPLLLHAYFRVDAGRRTFAHGRQDRNKALLKELGGLAVLAVDGLLGDSAGGVDLTPLAGLLADTGAGDLDAGDDKELLNEFRAQLLEDLDNLRWAPATPASGSGRAWARPGRLLIELDEALQGDLLGALPPAHLALTTDLLYPATGLSRAAMHFLAARAAIAREADTAGITRDLLISLLRPVAGLIWPADRLSIDEGFRTLLRVLTVLRARKHGPASVLDEEAVAASLAFIPVVDLGLVGRRLRPPAFAAPWIFARPQAAAGQPIPPPGLALDFLPDGLLPDDTLIRSLAYLGIQDYRVDPVLDALTEEVLGSLDPAVTSFIWRFLARDTTSNYSPLRAAGLMTSFVPGRWFWSQAGLRDREARQEMNRNRDLSRLPLRCMDGQPRPARELAFGSGWADWLEARPWPDAMDRAAAYRDLERAAPSPRNLLAPPAVVLADLGVPPADEVAGVEGDVDADRLVHAFLVRIGVWEVPPVESWNDLRERSSGDWDPWASSPGRAEHMALASAQAKALEGRGHGHVHVGEDFALSWPLSDSPQFLAALSRGVRLYERCQRQAVYCPRCSVAGGHEKKAWAHDESDRPSMLRWQMETTEWVPVSLHADPSRRHARPDEAWRDGDAIDPSRLWQSAAQFLQLVSPDVPAPLRNFLRIDQVDSADAGRLAGLLEWLHDHADEVLGDDRRPASDAGRSFLSLHRRIYERLADLGNGAAVAATVETGVLCIHGGRLVFAERRAARHDKGNLAVYRRLFSDDVPFVVLRGEQAGVAGALGVADFEVGFERLSEGAGEPATDEVQGFLHDRIPYIMTILVGYAVGGNTIDLAGRRFHARARRLASIKVFRVRDLELLVKVKDTTFERRYGKHTGDEIYVEDPVGAAPQVFHDFDGLDWDQRFRRAFAPHLASIVENDAYTMVFRPLLEARSEDEVIALMAEMGLSEQVEEVRRVIDAGDRLIRDDEERWWSALLPLLRSDLIVEPMDVEWPRRLQRAVAGSALAASLEPNAIALLVRSGVTEGSRRDVTPRGVLATLERAGVDLRQFHEALLRLNDRGLRVQAGAQRLADWQRAHEREVVAVLAHVGDPDAEARPAGWSIPATADWTTQALPADYLSPVLRDLRSVGLSIEPDQLDGSGASAALAALVDKTPGELWDWWTGQHGPSDSDASAARLAGWRRLLPVVLTAATTTMMATRYEVRSVASLVDTTLGSARNTDDVVAAIRHHLPDESGLRAALVDYVANFRRLALPNLDELCSVAIEAGLGADRIERVRAILKAHAPEVAERIRRDIAVLDARKVDPVEVVPDHRPDDTDRERGDRVRVTTVKHRSVDTGRIGRAGERWAKAVVMRELQSLDPPARLQAVGAIEKAIRDRFEDVAVDRLLGAAADYRTATDEDEAIEALSALVHASQVSDAFGFDLVGYLRDASGQYRVLLLEVKATADRKFMVSRHEWKDVATHARIRDVYAFMTVGRDDEGQPKAIEILVNPAALHEAGRLRLRIEDWRATYRTGPGGSIADEPDESDDSSPQ
jgi:hypothetical protein